MDFGLDGRKNILKSITFAVLAIDWYGNYNYIFKAHICILLFSYYY